MSSLPVVYTAEAREDLDTVYQEYERVRPGLGARFFGAVNKRVDLIEANPRMYAILYHGVRAANVHRFPHVIYYRIRSTEVEIIAVQHGRRDRSSWTSRI
jgi:plasmid stabilization system protein ParE